jgi:hypothetical protein
MLANGGRRASFSATGTALPSTLLVMRLSCSGFWLILLSAATACGGRSREPETGSAGGGARDACSTGKDAYQHEREQILQRAASSGCKQDADCGSLWESNACVSTCGSPLPLASVDAATAELNAMAKNVCATCPAIPVPPCVPPGPLKCVQGQCAEGP